MRHDKDSTENVELDQLIKFREYDLESCLQLGQIAIKTVEKYRELAESLSRINPVAKYIPSFTLSLLDKQGSLGSIEFAIKNELEK